MLKMQEPIKVCWNRVETKTGCWKDRETRKKVCWKDIAE